jgi:hypothetical protein
MAACHVLEAQHHTSRFEQWYESVVLAATRRPEMMLMQHMWHVRMSRELKVYDLGLGRRVYTRLSSILCIYADSNHCTHY